MRGRECAPFAPFSLIVYQKYKSSQKCTKCTRFRIRGRESAPFHLFRFSIRQTENKIRLEFNERRKICRPDLQREWVKELLRCCASSPQLFLYVLARSHIFLLFTATNISLKPSKMAAFGHHGFGSARNDLRFKYESSCQKCFGVACLYKSVKDNKRRAARPCGYKSQYHSSVWTKRRFAKRRSAQAAATKK